MIVTGRPYRMSRFYAILRPLHCHAFISSDVSGVARGMLGLRTAPDDTLRGEIPWPLVFMSHRAIPALESVSASKDATVSMMSYDVIESHMQVHFSPFS